jgi:hypothetical protein
VLGRQVPKGVEYVGVDASKFLVRKAQAYDTAPQHRYAVADVTRPYDVAPKSTGGGFSHAAFVLSLQNMRDQAAALRIAGERLGDQGRLVVVLNHPCFRVPRQSRWEVDPQNNAQYRRVDRYHSPLEVPIVVHPGVKKGGGATVPSSSAAAKSEGAHNNNAAEGSAPSFEESFATLVRSFGALPREQRTETVRRTVRGCPDRETMNDLLGHLAAAGMMGSFGLATTNGGLPSSASYDATPLPLPSSMRHIKPEPSSELADQVVDLGLPAPGAGSFGSASTPRLPSLPYLTGYEGMPMPLGQMIQLQPPSLQGGMPAQQQQQGGAADEGERKSGQFSQSDIDTNKLYNEIFASWPYDNLNNSTNGLNNTSLSQSQSQSL